MTEHYSMFLIAWMFLLLIGAWVLVNALIDVGARRVRRWVSRQWDEQASHLPGSFHRDRTPR